MEQYIPKSAVVAEIRKRFDEYTSSILKHYDACKEAKAQELGKLLTILDTIEVKEVNLLIHTIIAECCDWLATHTNLSHDEIEGCRNLMLTVKDESLKAQKGE